MIKPKLIPFSVPWSVDPAVPHLELFSTPSGRPLSATFIGYFMLDERPSSQSLPASVEDLVFVADRPPFEPKRDNAMVPYRQVRINFVDGRRGRTLPAYADAEVIPEDAYDWSSLPCERVPGEGVREYVKRLGQQWLDTGQSPNPLAYEVENSPWLAELEEEAEGLHHYLFLGHEIYVEVLAKGWTWEAGQPA